MQHGIFPVASESIAVLDWFPQSKIEGVLLCSGCPNGQIDISIMPDSILQAVPSSSADQAKDPLPVESVTICKADSRGVTNLNTSSSGW